MKKKIISVLLTLTVLFSLIACNKNGGGESVNESLGGSDIPVESGLPVVNNEYIVKNGSSEYEILYPSKATATERLAVSEFADFFKEATKISLRTTSDDKMKADGKYISVGYTKLLENAGYTYSASELKSDGFKIKTSGDDVLIFGASDYGTIYGVYETLGYLFDFEYFFNDSYRLNKGVTNLNLYDFDVVEIPDIEYRATGYGSLSSNPIDCFRLRMRPYPEFFIGINGVVFHNGLQYVKNSPLFDYTWISEGGDQLCYTAHGDEEELQNMLDASFDVLTAHLISNPTKNIVTYTIEDNQNFCTCESCISTINEYNGANSAVVILYLNKLNAMIQDWFKSEEGAPYARDLDIVFFAYNATTDAPVVFNEETQKYEGINGLTIDKGISVLYAPIAVDFTESLTTGDNAQFYKTAKQWSDISPSMYLWLYSTNFVYYLTPYDSFDGIADNYAIAKEIKTRWIFDQAVWNDYGFTTGWSNLKSYLNAKLSWDASLDVDVLIDEYFETCFGPGANDMREYFSEMRVLTTYNKENNGLAGLRSIYQNVLQEKFWPKMILAKWIEHCDDAIAKIEPLKDNNPLAYQNYYKNIAGERLSAYYLFISLYTYNTEESIIKDYQMQFKQDAQSLGLTLTSEGNGTVEALINSWGI